MKTLIYLATSIGVIVVLLLIYFAYSGFFRTVTVAEKQTGNCYLVGVARQGDYKDTQKIQDSLLRELLKLKMECFETFGIFYDNPQIIAPQLCQSFVGCVINSDDTLIINELRTKSFMVEKQDLKTRIVAEFPYRNKMSVYAGVFKVYPKLLEFAKNKNYYAAPIMEVYNSKNQIITYSMEIRKE